MQLQAPAQGCSATHKRGVAPKSSVSSRAVAAGRVACIHNAPAAASRGVQRAPLRARRASARQVTVHASANGSNGASQPEIYDVVVVGAGICGLVTAQALASKHSDRVGSFLVTEARERVGGNITSMSGDGYIWEEGPNSFQPNDWMLQAAVDSGCEKELVFGDPTAPRFVFWEKKLRATPSGPDVVTFDLLSLWGKIRAGLGAVGIANGTMPPQEESVEQFIRRNLGAEVFERLIEPFCSGVYAGDPSKLSMKAAFQKIWILEKEGGSLIGGALKLFQDKRGKPAPERDPRLPPKPKGQTVGSFRSGLKTLPEAIGAKLADHIRCNWKLQGITKDPAGTYTLSYETPDGNHTITTRTVALTAPAYVVADMIRSQAPGAADALASFDYPPVGAVTVAYPISAVKDERKDAAGAVPGFGQLHPRSQGITTLGTIYSSSLFPGRCPDGEMLLLNYIGGATNRGIVNQTHEQLVEQVDKDLRTMLIKDDAPKPRMVGVRVWPRAIPQFNVGHGDTLEKAEAGLRQAGWDGVMLGGNYVSGVALGKVVEFGYTFAGQLADKLAAGGAAPAAAKEAAAARR